MKGIDPITVVPFVEAAFDGMLDIAETLGDDLINERPDLRGANSGYVILHHCVAVAEWWIGVMIGDRPPVRDRDAEFLASGTVQDLRLQVADVRSRMAGYLEHMDPAAPIRHAELVPEGSIARNWSMSAALIHTLEELAQHRGQMELTRDILTAE